MFKGRNGENQIIHDAVEAARGRRIGFLERLATRHLYIPSAEGVRYGGSDMPIPVDTSPAVNVQPIETVAASPTDESASA